MKEREMNKEKRGKEKIINSSIVLSFNWVITIDEI
jgi:hypothetical protein